MKKAKGIPLAKGIGFGDALFNVKDMQMDYASFNEDPLSGEAVPRVQALKKNPIAAKPQSKPVMPSKGTTSIKPKNNPMQQQQQSILPKSTFKMPAGKQFQNNVNFLPLNPLACTTGVYQLSPSKAKSTWEYNIFCDGVPASEIVDKPQVSFSFNTDDIKQGNLGNCYFVSSLASIAHLPQVLKARIPNHKEYDGKTKTFKVNLFESGKCIEMLVDNLFARIYCKPVLNDISPIILEKAYAQAYGNFQVLKIGHANDSLRDLTGAPAIYLDIKNKAQLKDKIKSAFLNKYAMVIASKPKTAHPSISSMHSYTIVNYQIINSQLYLMLCDPRGTTKACFQVPEKLANIPGLGLFWVDQKNLQLNFQVISVCKVRRGYQYYYKTFDRKQLLNNRGGLLMKVASPMKVYVTIHQKHKKFFDQHFAYDILRVLITEVTTEKNSFKVVRTLESDFNSKQACVLEAELPPGNYVVLGEIGKKKGKELFPKEFFTLSVYSQPWEVSFQQMTGNIDVKPFLMNQIKEKGDEYLQSSTPQGLCRFQVALFGYICMYYENRGVKKVVEELDYTAKNVEIGEKKIQLLPHSNKMIVHAIGAENNCSYKWSMKSKTLFT